MKRNCSWNCFPIASLPLIFGVKRVLKKAPAYCRVQTEGDWALPANWDLTQSSVEPTGSSATKPSRAEPCAGLLRPGSLRFSSNTGCCSWKCCYRCTRKVKESCWPHSTSPQQPRTAVSDSFWNWQRLLWTWQHRCRAQNDPHCDPVTCQRFSPS